MIDQKLSAWRRVVFWLGLVFLSAVGGAVLGTAIGLLAATFIPMCQGHSCLVFRGMYGYEAAAFIGSRIGLAVMPPIAIGLVLGRAEKG